MRETWSGNFYQANVGDKITEREEKFNAESFRFRERRNVVEFFASAEWIKSGLVSAIIFLFNLRNKYKNMES